METRAPDGSFRRFLSGDEVKSIADRLRKEGEGSTLTPAEARVFINTWSSWHERMRRVLNVLGDPGKCKECGAAVRFCTTDSQRRKLAVELNGRMHLSYCEGKQPDHRAGKDD